MSAWLDTATDVRAGEVLDQAALEPYLRAYLPDYTGDLTITQFPSGFSNLTYLLRFGDRECVLRRPPFGAKIKSGHDMGREFRILSHLAPVYEKVPRPLAFCEDEAVLGAPFYVMERVHGVILRAHMPKKMIPDPATMQGIAETFVDTLVELHRVDVHAAGLNDLGRPEGYIERQITGWTKRYHRAQTNEIATLDQTAQWLATHQPAASATALIHNDFKYDNLVLDPTDWTNVMAVLDWEMATLGDPLMDLGTTLGYWINPDDPPAMHALRLSPTTLPGNPTRAALAEQYAQKSGRDLGDIVFYYVYGLFKIAVIVQQIYARYQQGHTQDPRFANLIHAVRSCGDMAQQAIEKQDLD